jgi:hypothetical protein
LHGVQKCLKSTLIPVSNLWDVLLLNANSVSIDVAIVIEEAAYCIWFIVYKLWQDDAIATDPLHQFMVRNNNISRVLLSVCFRFNSYIHIYIHRYIHSIYPLVCYKTAGCGTSHEYTNMQYTLFWSVAVHGNVGNHLFPQFFWENESCNLYIKLASISYI